MIGRLQQTADFRRLLDAPVRRRSAHFAVHYVCGSPSRPLGRVKGARPQELSTGDEPSCPEPVDERPAMRWLGCMVPKRHARRAVTRSLLKRQIRAVAAQHEAALDGGLWLIRLSRPFSPRDFPSAASDALRQAARGELDRLLASLAAPAAAGAAP